MTYNEAVERLYALPVFQHSGPGAYKPGTERVEQIAAAFGNPHKGLTCIHVGGTNGKGSTSHTLAAVLQSAGYRVGLYTSPHLVDFRERIRIDGEMIPQQAVVEFMERYERTACPVEPSFFELATIMAFDHFNRCGTDVVVVEVGLGGRLDATNIITPALTVITNISLDHTALLGDTLPQIAAEKAGIIKKGVQAVIGRADIPEVREVFRSKAESIGAPIDFAEDRRLWREVIPADDAITYTGTPWGTIDAQLTGDCQIENTNTLLHALSALLRQGWNLPADAVKQGFAHVCSLTGLMGRWMHVEGTEVETVCDTGHNPGGWEYLGRQLTRESQSRSALHMVIGFVADKDVDSIIGYMPRGERVVYHFVQPSVARAKDAATLASQFAAAGIAGDVSHTVAEGYRKAQEAAKTCDGGRPLIFVGGSTFIVADFLADILAD